MADFPRLAFRPGDYAAEWYIGDRSIVGDLSLEPSRPPAIGLFGDVELRDWSRGVWIPQRYDHSRLMGKVRSGQDVVLTDVRLSIWGPQRSLGSARHAVVGNNVARTSSDAYARIRFQITDLDLLFGAAPIGSVSFPGEGVPHMHGRFGIELNPEANYRWDDEQDGLEVECTYDIRFSLSNSHRHQVVFAPVVSFASQTPLTVDEWIDRWVMPMLHLAALATRGPQRLSWLTVSTAPVGATGEERGRHPSGVVFGDGIEQAPYEADYREEWRKPENRPLFTLASIPVPLPALLRRWVSVEADDNPFMELYGQTLRQTDLPQRARFLYLIQALEALHSYEHEEADSHAQQEFEVRRSEVIQSLETVQLPDGVLSFIRNTWSKHRLDNLDRRLRELIRILPGGVRERLTPPAGGEVAARLVASGETDLPGQFRQLRNDLSHGSQNYEDRSLRAWVDIAETLCRAHALRLLGFDDEDVERGLAPPPDPVPPA